MNRNSPRESKTWIGGILVSHRRDGSEQISSPPIPALGVAAKISVGEKTEPSWPIILLPLKLLAQEDDRGAGDIIARVIGPIGGDPFKVWYKRLFGKDCGCRARQETLNARWPLAH